MKHGPSCSGSELLTGAIFGLLEIGGQRVATDIVSTLPANFALFGVTPVAGSLATLPADGEEAISRIVINGAAAVQFGYSSAQAAMVKWCPSHQTVQAPRSEPRSLPWKASRPASWSAISRVRNRRRKSLPNIRHREKESGARGYPAAPVARYAATGDDHVDVRMVRQGRAHVWSTAVMPMRAPRRTDLTNDEIARIVAWSPENVERIRRLYVDDAAVLVALAGRINRAGV